MTIRAIHLNQIRSEIVEAEAAVGIIDGPWSVWSPGSLVQAASIVSLRQNVQ
jgi:hypothetical protein